MSWQPTYIGRLATAYEQTHTTEDGHQEDGLDERPDDEFSKIFGSVFDASGEISDANWLGPLGSGEFAASSAGEFAGYSEFAADSDHGQHVFGAMDGHSARKMEDSLETTAENAAAQELAAATTSAKIATKKPTPAPAGTKVALLKCSVEGCNYSTLHSRYLRAHEARHVGLKPHQCPHPGCEYR